MANRKRRIVLVAKLLVLTPIILFVLFFRLGGFRSQEITREIRYQVLDFGEDDLPRFYVEALLGNWRIWVVDERRNFDRFYVSKADFRKLWPEPWPDMDDKNYTIEATFRVRPLIFNSGYSVAEVTGIKQLNKKPYVTK